MKFGLREICDVTFKALNEGKVGSLTVHKGQPVLFIDSAKTSTLEGAGTTVYATGGKGNNRLISWEGERTLTFTVEDALLSEMGFAVLSGAGVFDLDGKAEGKKAMVHCTSIGYIDETNHTIKLEDAVEESAPIFVMSYSKGSIGEIISLPAGEDTVSVDTSKKETTIKVPNDKTGQVFVDYYVKKDTLVTELQIDASNFGGYYYVEGATLFRDEDGKDYPAEIILPKVKVQSNFTFNMSNSGDPSTFSFVMDAMPGYTMFDRKHKVLCAMQVISDYEQGEDRHSVTEYVESEIDGEVTKADSLGNARS